MRKSFNVAGLNQVFQKGISAFSTARRNLDLSNRWAMACWGAKVAQRYIRAQMPAWSLR